MNMISMVAQSRSGVIKLEHESAIRNVEDNVWDENRNFKKCLIMMFRKQEKEVKKGLRGSIPKNFPYFHFEFGLKEGFVHVINDELQFNKHLGLNVIREMLQLLDEDMHRHIRYDSIDRQKPAVETFAQQWEPFDWTKQLD
ncbi:hypothetical protein Syun_031263 [Stephania yunnanensis]|uniref:Cwf19-like protein C-terminal domain-containing protein n=1 Tax=Stephania yunnanensis TaxID=152371 RepID=A0AAP0HDU7_9MAGN